MTDYKPPCQTSATPDDWFIERDGKQYSDDPILPFLVEQEIFDRTVAEAPEGLTMQGLADLAERAVTAAEAVATKEALVRRRHAKDACHRDCKMRLQCLDIGLSDDPPLYGTYGGYHQDELRQIRSERDSRRSRRPGLD